MADAARRLRRRCASFDRRQHAGAPRGYAMEHVGGQRCSCHACQQIYAARQSVPYNGPSPSASSSTVLIGHYVREMQTRCASVVLTNIHYVRDLSGTRYVRARQITSSRHDRRITSRAAAACKTRLHAAPAAVRRAKAPRTSGPRGIDWTGRENQWQWMTVPRTAASAVRNSLRARPRYVRVRASTCDTD